MNQSDVNRWPAVILFLTSGLFFFGCVWYLWAGNFQPDQLARTGGIKVAGLPVPTFDPVRPILLIKDRETIVGNTRVIYRGRRNGILRVDLYILSLDPHFTYAHHIDEASAKRGFQMGEHSYRLLAAGRGSIRLVRM